jgi:hypothetical protein
MLRDPLRTLLPRKAEDFDKSRLRFLKLPFLMNRPALLKQGVAKKGCSSPFSSHTSGWTSPIHYRTCQADKYRRLLFDDAAASAEYSSAT